MTQEADPAAARPRVRRDISVGPALMRGSARIHMLKDPVSGKMMTVGDKEHFIISRLDGHRTLADVTTEYGAEFGRRLDDRAWGRIMATLAGRSILEGSPPPEPAEPASYRQRPTFFHARLPLARPGPWLERAAGRMGWAFSPAFVLPALAAALLACATVALNLGALLEAMARFRETPWVGVFAIAVLWGVLALHELGHGLAAARFGARVGDIGIGWRFPLLTPYCAVEEIQMLPARKRVYIAFAGVFVSLLVLPLALVLWVLAPEGSSAHVFASVLLLFGTVAALSNFVPFFRLDGYSMINHALGTENLARDSTDHVLNVLRERAKGLDRGRPRPPRSIRIAYVSYAVSAALFYTVLILAFAAWWFALLQHLLGPWAATGLLVATAIAITIGYRINVVRKRDRDGLQRRPRDKEGI